MGAKKILILDGDFVEDHEVMAPFQTLQAVGTGARRLSGQSSR